jgi:hypothetical protein
MRTSIIRHGPGVVAALSLLLPIGLAPTKAEACACGCGVFDVATSSMFPSGAGGTVFFSLDFQNQNRNWSGSGGASSADNDDKRIKTFFYTFGFQYMFNRSWGVQVELPYWNRTFSTDVGSPGAPDVQTARWGGIGDIRIKGIYTGFSDDMSTGITYGLKLPTGNYAADSAIVDPDSQIGTGSTDILLGGFHRQALTADNQWSWFAQAQLDVPVLIQNEYRPGAELDMAAGVNYNGWSFGDLKLTPVAQIIGSIRGRDSGANAASPVASGYQRILLSPGIEADYRQFSAYADVEVPVFQHVNGDQLTAPFMVKMILAYNF